MSEIKKPVSLSRSFSVCLFVLVWGLSSNNSLCGETKSKFVLFLITNIDFCVLKKNLFLFNFTVFLFLIETFLSEIHSLFINNCGRRFCLFWALWEFFQITCSHFILETIVIYIICSSNDSSFDQV